MAKTLLEQYDEWKQKKQKEEQQASQPKYTIPDSGSILEQYQAYKQQRQANEQKALSSKRINNPSHLGNVMIAGAVQNTQKKQAEAGRVAKEEEARRVKQEEKQSWNDYVQRLTDQYMPVRSDPIPQVDINKKYGPVSELTKRGATIASSSVSDAPFGFGKIIDLSGDGGSMSVRNSAMEEADRERTEQAERDRKDQAARDGLDARIAKDQRARLEREHTAALAKLYSGTLSSEEYAAQEALAGELADRLNGDDKRVDAVDKPQNKPVNGWDYDARKAQDIRRVEQEDELANRYQLPSNSRGGRIVSDKVALEGALETADRERDEFAQRDMQGAKEREAVLERNLSVEDLQAKRAAAEKDIEQYNKVLEWVPSPQNVEAYQNYLAAQTQKKAAQEGIEQIDTFTLIKQLKDQASKETEPYELAYINSKLQAAEYKYKWSTMDPEERANTWVWQRVERGFRNYNRAYYGLTTDLIADILGIDRSEVSKQNQKQLDVINKEIAYQAQSASAIEGAAGDILTMAVENLPNIVLSFLGGGGLSVAANAAMDLKTAAAPFVTKFLNSFTKMAKNPMWWNSFMRSAGNNYINEHDVKGNDPIISLTAASIKGFLDSTIEVGGGIETGEFKPLGFGSMLRSGGEEMGEEFFQGPVSNAYDFSQSGKGADTKLEDIVSWDNPNAIISGKQMAQEGIMGFAGGVALSGMQQAGVAAVGAAKGQDLSAEPRSEYNYPEANIDQQIASKEAEIAKLESDAREAADRERMDFETRDGEAAKKYSELVTLVNESFPEESETKAKIAEATTIDIKRMTEIATGAMQELRARMQTETSPEVLKLSETLTQTVEGIFAGMQTDRNAITDKYTAGLDEGLKAEIKGKNDVSYAKGYGIAHALGTYDVDGEVAEKITGFGEAKTAAEKGREKWRINLPATKSAAEEQLKKLPAQGKGGATVGKGVNQDKLSKQQKNQIGFMSTVGKYLGVDFVFIEFAQDADGNYVTGDGRVAPNGFYRGKDGKIYIDVNAGKTPGRSAGNSADNNGGLSAQAAIIPLTAGHELGHLMKSTMPEVYNQLVNAVIDEMISKGVDVKALIEKQMGKAKLSNMTPEGAIEEMVNEATSGILQDSQAVRRMAEKNPGLVKRIAEWVKDFVARMRKAFANLSPMEESESIMEMRDGVRKYTEKITSIWDSAFTNRNAPSAPGALFTADVGDGGLNNTINSRINDIYRNLGENGKKAFNEFMEKVSKGSKRYGNGDMGYELYTDALDVWENQYNAGLTGIIGPLFEIEQALERFNDETINGILAAGEQDAKGNQGTKIVAEAKPATVTREDVQAVAKEAATKKTAYTSDGQAVDYHYEVVPVGSLIPSNLEISLEPNTAYPQELQPRDRTRAASQQQVEEIANKLNPALLGESADVGTGAPFVGPDMVVESGNGRILAITRAMRQGKGLTYTQWLKDNAARFGIDPAKVDNASVLVRVRDTEVNRPEFVQKANESQVATYSDSESAVSDAKKVTPAMLEMANMDSGDINSAGNSGFVSSFISKVVPVAERGRMMDASGKLSKSGENRVRTALFQMAYEDGYLTEQMAEASDDTSKNILKAMTAVAPRLALMNDAMKNGTLSDYPIGQAIAEAYRIVQRQKRLGVSVDRYINQQSLVRQDTPAHWMLLEMFNENRKAPNRMADALNSILNAAERQGNPNQMLMPGLEAERPSVEGIVRDGLNRYADEGMAAGERDTLKFQMREPVEETAKLIAVHNLSEAQLLSSVELGGFAMPSIAVIRAGQPHDRYGDISIVFGKETIDPENYGNKVYGGDAWTPSFPNIDYEISETAAQAVRKKASELLGPYYKDMRPGLDDDNMQDVINRAGGDPVKAYEDNNALKAAYLRDIGENFTPRYSEPDYGSEFGNDVVKYVADRMGDKVKEALSGDRKQFMSIEPDVRKVLNERDNGKFGGDMYSQPFGFGQVDRLARAVAQYMNSKGIMRFDATETGRDIREAMKEGNHEAGYKAWLKNMFGGIVSKSGIRNNAEFFTPSGNRRSFDALHWSVTLENVVRSMKSQDGKGVDSMGGGGLFGVSTKNYNSLDDIRKDIDRLQLMDEEQYQTKKDEFRDRIIELADEIAPKSERNRFTALDRASEVLTEAARKGTTAGIQRVLNGYKDYYNIREDTAKKLYKLMSDISRMPTEYFEAKPERAVGFDEVRAVVLPDTAGEGIKKALSDMQVPVIEYKSDDNADRLKALNSPELDGVKFQERDTQYLAAVESGDMDTAQKMVDEAAKAAGYTNKVFHGTDAKFTVFDTDEESTEREVHAWIADYADGTIFATTDKTGAGYYGQNVMPLYIKPEDVKRFKAKDGMSAAQAIDDIYGYEVFNYHVIAVKDDKHTIYATLDNTLLKSADPVTYDDSGNPIPLSQRFTDSNDIRFQERDSDNAPLSPEQIEYFKDSKVRDAQGRLLKVYHGTTRGFTEFRTNAPGQTIKDTIGSHFGTEKAANDRLGVVGKEKSPYGENVPSVMDVFLNITNPLLKRGGSAMTESELNAYLKRVGKKLNIPDRELGSSSQFSRVPSYVGETIQAYLKEQGHDGIPYINSWEDRGNVSYIAFSPEQIKSTTNLTPTSSPDIRYQERDPAPAMYSKMAQEIEAYKGDKMGADSVVKYLQGRGVKADEIRWSGIVPFLQGKKSVSKAELLEFARASALRVEDFQLGGRLPVTDIEFEQMGGSYNVEKSETQTNAWELRHSYSGRVVAAVDQTQTGENAGKWESLPGIYSEMEPKVFDTEQQALAWLEKAKKEDISVSKTPTMPKDKFSKYKLNDGTNYRELLFTAPDLDGNFQSQHWDEENVLAHTRLQDFQTPDGKPVLFIEEVQSDWHEKGREEGYVDDSVKSTLENRMKSLSADFDKLQKELNNTINSLQAKYDYRFIVAAPTMAESNPKSNTAKQWRKLTDEEKAHFSETRESLNKTHREILEIREELRLMSTNIPQAPFATTWHEYVLKRVLRMAAEGGYDYVGWTTGKMQADRYSLEKVLSELTAIKRTDGTYFITAKGKDGQYLTEDRVSVTKLPSVVGKEMARKIVGGDNVDTTFEAPAIKEWTTKQHFEGLDLKVGGEGMKAFYDIGGKSSQNIPRFLNKYGAQWGAKIQTIDMQGTENTYQVPAIEVTDAMKESVLYEGQPLYQERDSTGKELTQEQAEYFKDSKVRDAKGRLLPVYHGTEKAGFHEFSESDDIGYFFTSSSRLASTYSGTYKDYAPARIDTWEQAKAYAEKNNIDFEENDDEYIIDGDTFVEEELKFAEDLLNELTAESSANYNVYLNLKDPYIIDAGGSNWNAVIEQSGTMKMFSELTKTEKKRISENMGLEVGEIYDITDDYGNSLAAFDVDNFYFNYPRTTREIVQEAVDMGADGVIIRDVEDGGKYSYGGDTGDVYVALNPEQIKSTANLTPTSSPDIRYQERDPDYRTKRDILAGAFDSVAQTEGEKRNLKEYKNLIGSLNRMEEEARGLRQANTAEWKKAEPDRAKVNENKKRIFEIEKRIFSMDKKLIQMQNAAPLRNVLIRQKREFERTAVDKYKGKRDTNELNDALDLRADRAAKRLMKYALTPDKNSHVPDGMRTDITNLLTALDLASEDKAGNARDSYRARSWQEALTALGIRMKNADMVAATTKGNDEAGPALLVDPALQDKIESLIKRNDGVVRYRNLKTKEKQTVVEILESVSAAVSEANKKFSADRTKTISDVADKTIDYAKAQREKKLRGEIAERLSTFLNIDMADAFTFFDSLGEGGQEILKGLYNEGFSKLVRNTEEARAFFDGLNAKYGKYGMSTWGGKNATPKNFKVASGTLTMTPAQVMELYMLNKREQARGHIYGQGIRVERIRSRKPGKAAVLWQKDALTVTPAEIEAITSTLTEQQKQVAEEFGAFFGRTSTKWGNEVSMTLYGYYKFIEQNYYPIHSDTNFTMTQDPNSADMLYALLNIGATKDTVKFANNPIIISDIFDTVTRHITDMANYNAFAPALVDAMKWFNYKRIVKDEAGNMRLESVKGGIERMMGAAGKNYVINLLKAVNGIKNPQVASGFAGMVNSAIGKFKTSAVGANARVVLQQHASYVRGSALLSPAAMTAAYFRSPRRGMQMARKYSAIAAWKHMGYFDMNIGRQMSDLINGNESTAEKIRQAAMKPAGLADDFTIGVLWNAAEIELGKTYKGDKRSEEFYKLVGEKLTEVIDRTQVVDTVFHRSQIMRDKDGLTKIATNFMSEPIKTYNLLMSAVKTGDLKTIARTGTVALLSYVVVAMAAGFSDAARDKDKEKGWQGYWESWMKNVLGIGGNFFESNVWDNMNPLNMIPFGKDVYGLATGYSPSRPDLQAAQRMIWAANDWMDLFKGEDKDLYKLIYNTANAISTASGIPISNVMRDVKALYDTLDPRVMVGDSATLTYKRFADALVSGDEEKALAYYNALIDSGKDAGTIRTQVMNQYKENDAVKAAAEAKKAGDYAAYEKAIDQAVKDGIPRDMAIKAADGLSTEKAEKVKPERAKAIDEVKKAMGYKDTYTYESNDLMSVIEKGDNVAAKKIIDKMLKEGRKKDAISGNISTYFKDKYIDAYKKGQASNLKAKLLTMYALLGYDRDKKSKDIDAWLK